MRHRGVESGGVGGDLDAQPVLETDLLDRQVELQVFELAAQRHLLRLDVVEHRAQQVAQPGEHLLGLRSLLLADQHHDRIERVEQEVRLELHLERAELGLHEPPLKLGGLELQAQRLFLALLIPAVVAQRVLDTQHRPIADDVAVEAEEHQEDQGARERLHDLGEDPQAGEDGGVEDEVGDREAGAEQQMERHPARPDPPFDGEPAAEPQDHRGEEGAEIDPGEPGGQVVPPGRGVVPQQLPRQVLGAVEEADGRPGEEDRGVAAQGEPVGCHHSAESTASAPPPGISVTGETPPAPPPPPRRAPRAGGTGPSGRRPRGGAPPRRSPRWWRRSAGR